MAKELLKATVYEKDVPNFNDVGNISKLKNIRVPESFGRSSGAVRDCAYTSCDVIKSMHGINN